MSSHIVFLDKTQAKFFSIELVPRYSDKHPCDYDYKEAGADEIRKSNPVVAGEKVRRI